MKKPSLADRLRYGFDNIMSRGTISLIGWLALATVIVVVLVSLIVWLSRMLPDASLWDLVWTNLMETLDADPRGDSVWSFRLVMLSITFMSIFVTSMLIGVLTAGLEAKIEDLRKGRSRVVEVGHTVILGWSEQVFPIISELVVANANKRRSCIVILGDRDKVEMEDEIRDKVGSTGRTRIVCRSGNPMGMADLEIVGLETVKSIIVLSPEREDPDSSVIKTLLAIINNPARRSEPYHIVAEIRDPKNMDVARVVGRDEVELVLTGDLIARVMAQTCRQSGLSVVYSDLLDFAGDEIYFKEEPGLVGKTFGEALLAYEESAVMGLEKGGQVKLNPPMGTEIAAGDRVIAISEDDDTIRLSGLTDLGVEEGLIQAARPVAVAPEHVLVLGWNWRAPVIISELDSYVAPGSKVKVVADHESGEGGLVIHSGGVRNLEVHFEQNDTTSRRVLDELDLKVYNKVVLLSYSDMLDHQRADARTLITLLHLRDIADQGGLDYTIVTELLDIRNRELAEVARADDFVVSGRLVSLTLAQISENKALGVVFADLFDPDGAEIYLKPVASYVATGMPLNLYTVAEAACRRGEVLLGYRIQAEAREASKSYGVRLNPPKSTRVTFADEDQVIVLADE
jgi:voltage-gated potassium channel Kch